MPLPPPNREARLLRFGVFEVDLDAGELRRNGARIRLQEQPFQVLTALLQNAGQVVTREHLREKIWPADTFVDFDHSLNTAVIRQFRPRPRPNCISTCTCPFLDAAWCARFSRCSR